MPTVARLVRAGGLALVASEVLTLVAQGRSDPSLVAVWTVLLTVYTLALLRVTARRPRVSAGTLAAGAGGGLILAAAWVAAAVLEPSVPTANGPATVAIAAAALCAACAARRGAERQIAGLCAAAGCALLIAVTIDGPLRLFPAWVSTNAPPVDSPETAARLVGLDRDLGAGLPVRGSPHPRDPPSLGQWRPPRRRNTVERSCTCASRG